MYPSLKMNERFRLNTDLVRDYLARDDRKQSHLVKALNVSQSLVTRMLSEKEAYVPNEDTLKDLADLIGVPIEKLLLPRKATKSA